MGTATNDNASFAFSTPPPFTSSSDLHIPNGTSTVLESNGAAAGVTNDFDNQARNALTPDIGADEFAGIFLDVSAPVISYSGLGNVCTTGNRTLTGVIITDASGVPAGGPLAPRIYYRKNAGTYFSQAGTLTSGTGTNGTWDFAIIAADMGGLSTGDVVSYYVIAQDIATIPNIASNPGGVVATDVNTVITPPASPSTFSVTATNVTVTATATPSSICSGTTSNLSADGFQPQLPGTAPASYYALTPLSGQTYSTLTGGGITIINTAAQLTPTMGSGAQDDGGVVITLPFTFTYLGNTFTQMSMCTNGWVGAGDQGTIDAVTMRAAANLFISTTPNNTIAAWFKDMGANFPLGVGSMRHGLIGTDVYAFQWDKANGSSFGDNATVLISFQVNIYGPASSSPGRIEIIYGPTVGAVTFASSIGVEDGIGGTNHYLNALTGNGTVTTLSSAWPGDGNGYRFTALTGPLTYNWIPAASVVSPNSQNTATIPLVATTPFTVTATGAGGCTATANTTVTVTTSPSATIAYTPSTMCLYQSPVAVTLTGSTGGTFSAPAGLTIDPVTGTITPGTSTPGTYTVTYSIPPVGACIAFVTTTSVTINPTPTVDAVSNQSVCAGTLTTAVTFTGAVPGTVFNWTNNTTSIGLAASGSGNIAAFTALNVGTVPVTATITVTPSYTNAGGTCTGTPVTFTITVNPNTQITTQPVNATICAGFNTTFSTVAIGASLTYQWQISTTGSGGPWTNLTNVAPFSNVTTATLNITGAGTVYNGNFFRVVVTGTCGVANSNAAMLTVNPLPVVNAGPSGLCGPVTLTASGTANTYSWSPSAGLNTTTGATVIANPTVTTVYTVTGTITATGCQNTANVTVLGTPTTPVVTPSAPVVCAGQIIALSTINTSFAGGQVLIPAGAPTTTVGNASPYPATVAVSGLPVSGATVKSVTINGFSHSFPSDVDMVLQSPTGVNVILMSDAGGGNDAINANLIFSDAAATVLPGTIVTGTFKPTNIGTPDNWPAPGPGSLTQATPTLSSFTGDPNGSWKLFIVDQFGGDPGVITSWSINFDAGFGTTWTPVSGLFLDAQATIPYTAGTLATTVYFVQSPTVQTNYTYTVANVGACTSGTSTVTVTVNPLPTIAVTPNNQCSPVTLTATGNSSSYSWSPAAGLSATTGATVVATPSLNTTYTVTGTISGTGCTNSANVTVNATPSAPVITPASISICANAITQLTASPTTITTPTAGPIIIPAGGPYITGGTASPYPSAIVVGGLPTSGVRVKSVNINGFSHTFPSDVDVLLQSPNGTNTIIFSDAGGGTAVSNANLVFDDIGAGLLTTPIVSGTYKPTNVAGPDNFPAPGPGSVNNVSPALSSFTGNMNGTWNLYALDQFNLDAGSITSWSITFEIVGAVWTPVTGLFTDPLATIPYVAGTPVSTVYVKPAATTTYTATRVATATCNSAGTNVTVTVEQPITITTQPANVIACLGGTATFSVVTTGNFQSYQWQISTIAVPAFTNIPGANNASLVLTNVTAAMSGNQYRVIVTNTCSTVTSNAATLTVNPVPVVTVGTLPARICLTDTLISLQGLGSPVGGSWSGIGVSGFNFMPMATGVGTFTLTYSFTNIAGCTSTATVIAKVEDCPERIRVLSENAVLLYPNPNNGRFNIRINSTLYNYLNMKVFTSGGQQVRNQEFGGLVYGRVISVDLTTLPADVYIVKFYYKDGARTAEKSFKVIIGGHE
jgi:subtilisin-like proprotein convertase family protein